MRVTGKISSSESGVGPAAVRRARLGLCLATIVGVGLLVGPADVGAAERQKPGQAADAKRRAPNGPECLSEPRSTARVVSVIDSTTVSLDDGRLVRLATASAPAPLVSSSTAVAVPVGSDVPDGPASDWAVGAQLELNHGVDRRPAGDAARTALTGLIEARTVAVHPVSASPDRHGRIRAHLVTDDGRSVVAVMVAAGFLRVEPRRDDVVCARELLALEAEARAAGRGVWAGPIAFPLAAADPDLIEKAGRYAIVEGKVLSTGHAGTRTYLNFGRRFASDFTVVIDDKEMPRFLSAGFSPARLEGRTIRVRGWLTVRDGGFMTLSVPEEIEWVR